jgi:hypothetical protein
VRLDSNARLCFDSTSANEVTPVAYRRIELQDTNLAYSLRSGHVRLRTRIVSSGQITRSCSKLRA